MVERAATLAARWLSMTTVETVTGSIDGETVGLSLAHEHVFVDLLGVAHPDYGRVDAAMVAETAILRLAELRRLGVDLLVDCTSLGIGRDIGLLRDVSEATGVRIACATGIYKSNVPPTLADCAPDILAERFISELTAGVEGSDARAAIIKLATTETGPTPRETDVHRAGAIAAAATGCSIVLHCPEARVVHDVLATLEAEDFDPARLIWAHAHASKADDNLELAARGVTISLDAIGESDDADMLDRIERLVEAGHGDRVLVSTDTTVWMNPPELAYERSIEHLIEVFLPALEARLGPKVCDRLVRANVVRILTPASTTASRR